MLISIINQLRVTFGVPKVQYWDLSCSCFTSMIYLHSITKLFILIWWCH